MKIGKLIINFRSPITFNIEGNWMREVKQALREGKTLLAVKIYKDNTDKSLNESKDYVVKILKPKYYKPGKTEEFMDEVVRFFVTNLSYSRNIT